MASSSSKRSSSTRAKKVDYAALQEIKIEEVDCDDEFDTPEMVVLPKSPPKKKRKTATETEIVTEGKCGMCSGCRKNPCTECSFCNSGDFGNCIDLYCMNQKEGRSQREAAREAYLMSLGKARLNEEQEGIGDEMIGEKNNLSVKQQIDMIMAEIGAAQKERKNPTKKTNSNISSTTTDNRSKIKSANSPTKKSGSEPKKDPVKSRVHGQHGVYGGSPTAAKSRRCGECEGCMRDDCGQCIPCADKPRFGGPGTKKKACVQRFCRTRKLEEDHAQANFPLNSPDALKGPRPVSKIASSKKTTPSKVIAKKEKNEEIISDVIDEEEILDEQSSKIVDDNIADDDDNAEDIEDEFLQD